MPEPYDIQKFIRLNTLAAEISEMHDEVKLQDFVSDRIKEGKEIPSDKIVFIEIQMEDYQHIKSIIDKLKGKDIFGLGDIKIDLWFPSFPKETIPKEQIRYDLVISGSGLLIWPLGLLFDGRWLEEHLYFIDENFDDAYKNYDSWNSEKYISKELREKITELIGMVGKTPLNILCSPSEINTLRANGKNQRNLVELRTRLFMGVQSGKFGVFGNSLDFVEIQKEAYEIYTAILVSELSVASIMDPLEIVNNKFGWAKQMEEYLKRLGSLLGVSKHSMLKFMDELFCMETRNEMYHPDAENDKMVTSLEKDIIRKKI